MSGLAGSNLSFIFCSWMLQNKQKWGLDLPAAENLICLSGDMGNGNCTKYAKVQRS